MSNDSKIADKDILKKENAILIDELGIDKEKLKSLKKKLSKIAPRSEKGVETMFRLLSGNQYKLNQLVDKKASILISINALILSIVIGTVLNQLDKDPHLIYPATLILVTNLASISLAVFATRPERTHGDSDTKNLMFYGNFHEMEEKEYVNEVMTIMNKGDELYENIARDVFYLGKRMNKKFSFLRYSFDVFLFGIIGSVIAFLGCHILFGGHILLN